MKKRILLFGLSYCVLATATAQTRFELIPEGGYTFRYSQQFNNSDDDLAILARLNGGFSYGLSARYNMNRRIGVEIMYHRSQQPAEIYGLHVRTADDLPLYQTQAGINYLMAGMVFQIPVQRSPVNLFFGYDLGASFTTPSPNVESGGSGSNANFAMGLQGGTQINISPRLGIRLGIRVLISPQPDGYYFGNWGGTHEGWFDFLAPGLIQGDVSVGLIIGLGKILPEYQKQHRKHRKRRIAKPFSRPN